MAHYKAQGTRRVWLPAAVFGLFALAICGRLVQLQVLEHDNYAKQAEQELLGVGPTHTLYRACGCEACAQTGYKGRSGVYELMVFDETTRTMIHDGANEQLLRQHAASHGMLSLREDGYQRVRAGLTSLDEVLRVTRENEG